MSALRDLIAVFGFEVDQKGAKKAESVIEGFAGKIEKLGAALVGVFAFHETAEFIKGQIEAGSAIHDTALKLGVSNQALQQWQYLGKLAGVSAEEMAGALSKTNRTIGEAVTGNAEAAQTFTKLGITLKDQSGQVRSASDVTVDFVDRLSKMGSQAERTAAITKVMGRAGAQLLPAFSDGAEGVKRAFAEFQDLGGGLSDDFVNSADEAGDSIDRFKFAFSNLKSRIAGAVLPTLTKVTTWLAHATAHFGRLADRTNVIKAALMALGGGGVLLTVMKLAKIFGIADTGALGFVKTLLKMGPIVLLAAALFLAFEDIYTLMTGGDSLIGRFLGGEKSAKLVADLQGSFDTMGAALKDMLPVLIELGVTLIKAFVDALPAIMTVVTAITKGFAAALELFSGLVNGVSAAAKGDWAGVGKAVDKAGNAVFGKGGVFAGAFDGVGGNTSSNLADSPAWQEARASRYQVGGHAGLDVAALNQPVQQTNHTTVNVQGGMTNGETGRVVAGAVSDAQAGKQATLAAVRTTAPIPSGG